MAGKNPYQHEHRKKKKTQTREATVSCLTIDNCYQGNTSMVGLSIPFRVNLSQSLT